MGTLDALVEALRDGTVEVIDLTQPLSDRTPILQLPPPFANTPRFALRELSRYDDRGPAWYWNAIETGEHTGTHLDAPIHWVTGQDKEDVSQVPPSRLVGPAGVIDRSLAASGNPDYLLEVTDIAEFEAQYGTIAEGSWLLYRTGWDARATDEATFLNADES